MEGFWKQALKVSGPVAVIGFILWFTLQQFFSQNLLLLFDNEQQFTLILVIICSLIVVLLASILVHKKPLPQKGQPTKYKISDNKVQGDFVVGDKNVNQRTDDE